MPIRKPLPASPTKARPMKRTKLVALLFILCNFVVSLAQTDDDPGQWISLFNGENLDNWKVKFTGQPLGVNYRNTFRVVDGILSVSYDAWNNFDSEFGHLFYDQVFSHYLLRVEYRFVGDQVVGGPAWAYRNNGLMLHSQAPASMTLDQEFPVSIEAQLLGGNGVDQRTTANVCSPGTHWLRGDELIRTHCINSTSDTYHGNQWVTVEFEVRGNESIIHRIDDVIVFEIHAPQLDQSDPDAQRLIQQGADILLKEGYVALQAESHPTEFRKIELLPIPP